MKNIYIYKNEYFENYLIQTSKVKSIEALIIPHLIAQRGGSGKAARAGGILLDFNSDTVGFTTDDGVAKAGNRFARVEGHAARGTIRAADTAIGEDELHVEKATAVVLKLTVR